MHFKIQSNFQRYLSKMTKIGLEIHCQLTNLQSKLFCSCKANYREFSPNTNICPICVGLPGSLPMLNQKAVEKATMISMALNCKTPEKIAFFRKNYFYPDLPKNFQITQFDAYGPTSIGHDGKITIEGKEIRIRRIQIEEDPGRLIYEGTSEKTQIPLVDYNRAGTPLVEIVTERYVEKYGITHQVADILSSDKYYADLFEQSHDEKNAKEIANIITTDLMGFVDTREKRETSKLTHQHLTELVNSIMDNKITRNSAKTALQEMVSTGKSLIEIISE